jgi:hypothetical protein
VFSIRHLIATIEGRAKADGTYASSSLTAPPWVQRRLLEVCLGVAALGTVASGVLTVDHVSRSLPSEVITAESLLAAQATPAVRADIEGLQLGEAEQVADLVPSIPTTTVVIGQPVAVPSLAAVIAPAPAPAAPTSTSSSAPPESTTTSPPATTSSSTTPTTAAGSTQVAASAEHTYTPDEVKLIITEVFGPADGPAAIRVAHCESRLNPKAISRGGGNWGLFQLNTVHRKRVESMGYKWEDVLDPWVNARIAKQMFDGSGWRPWACKP